jgi:hypothetical protein
MLKKVGLFFVGLVIAFVVVVSTRPDSFRVERKVTLAAHPSVVFGLVNDFHLWQSWSPWDKLDPSMKREHSGSGSGVGASYYWLGNDQVGEGRMTITDSSPADRITIKLEFLKPWKAENITTFTFRESAGTTEVTWAMEGKNNFVFKAMQLFMNMDSMVGKDFENGLASLKGLAETEAKRLAEAEAKRVAAVPPPAPAPAPAVTVEIGNPPPAAGAAQ